MKITGKVIHGSGDGTKIGFPTANIELSELPDLDFGVYAGQIEVSGKVYNSVIHYGPRSVLGESHPQLEVHILEFSQIIYDQIAVVTIDKKIRDTIKFDSFEELIVQIQSDVKSARLLFNAGSISGDHDNRDEQ